ncbi:propanediol/glycerol family dehydratase large subunit [Clostridium fallax]|uniref:Glycerol dehydratase large subunit n=1 Tax=Clostridium fallax TaxID=1533 RepID=A0A1M4XC37_9CLOT|nr:propanediol/glycerol family dehydratase large subunit [Clostridium fallax]SHE91097.1 glycerol dehydratase large subunit [Clostridium fallax]SQB05983.1 glycerol dehydratase large subunit [Clostridium fallax]
MIKSKRFEALSKRPINKDVFMEEWAEKGFIAMKSPYDPSPSIKIIDDKIVEIDGKKREDFDFIDFFIADHSINKKICDDAMKINSLEFSKLMVDINTPRDVLIEIAKGFTPAKIIEVIDNLNVVEMMMAMQKLRARKIPANQAHITNIKDNPILIAADAAEGALRGFREEETTVGVVRYAPFNAIALLIGSQIGRKGVLTQCAVEEATELELAMRGFTTYAETMSVYGTENVFIDGDDTPYSKAFLNAAYGSRGLKTRFTSGTGSEVLMGSTEKKSMLYLETRCLMVTKGAGAQGVQNGAVSTIGITSSVPSGIRAVLGENLIAALLDLEVASSNDQSFSHSDIRRTARLLMQFLPGTDFIFSGYSGTPNYDNMFAGSNFDAEDFDDYNVLQRDLKIDGGLRPVKEEEVIKVRYKAAKVIKDLFNELELSSISYEEIIKVTYANGSKDVLDRNIIKDFEAIDKIMKEDITGVDIVKALIKTGHKDVAEDVLEMLKQRISGDYLQTSSILDEEFNVISAINNKNDYLGPGSGYRVSNETWNRIKNIGNLINKDSF